MSSIKDTKVYNINDFLNWHDNGELEISPKYQRNSVWNQKAKSYLIDTIVRGLPIPQIFLRQLVDTNTRKTMREVIDGQQRLRAITEFVNDTFPIEKAHNKEYAGKYYSDFDDEQKEAFLLYEVPVEIIKLKDDSVIYNMFSRVNTNSVTLNKQELRNSNYWGDFKVYIYELSKDCRQFFIENRTFTDKQFSRMIDIEYVSSLTILLLDGIISESQTVINNYYKRYDDNFEESDLVEAQFIKSIQIIELIFENTSTNYFHKKNYLYTLFAFVAHQMYGLKHCDSVQRTNIFSEQNIENNLQSLYSKFSSFESNFERFMSEELYNDDIILDLVKFEKNHRSRTTSQNERLERVQILSKYLT